MTTTNTHTEPTPPQTAADRAKEEIGRVGETAKEEAGHVVGEAKEQGRALLADATDRLKGEAQHQSQRAAENLRSISSDFRTMAQSTEGQGTAATWVRMGADQIDGLAERLEGGGFNGLMKDVGDFARRNPTTFLAVSFGAGLIAGRVVKNMDMDRLKDAGRDQGSDRDPTAPGNEDAESAPSALPLGSGSQQGS